MTADDKIQRLEHRVHELQTAVAEIIDHFGLQDRIAAVERARLDELRLTGEPEAPVNRLMVLYERPHP